jgi:fibronectin type 3 domain-containing protein
MTIARLKIKFARPCWAALLLSLLLVGDWSGAAFGQTFTHPGALHTQADFNRMAAKVAAGAHPWIDSYNKMLALSQAQTSWTPAPVPTIYRCGSGCVNNFSRSQQDALAIYYLVLRYRITGDANFASKAISIMDAWSGTCTNVSGDSNFALGAGLCGYEFAAAGEELRGYSGWSTASQSAYTNFLIKVFYSANHDFLTRHNNTCNSHYRCNWDCDNIASMLAVGVFCDNTNIFNEAVAYYTNGVGNGNIERAVGFIHADGLGQTEESGRDQAHNVDGFNSLSVACQIAWNQGVDLYGYDNNRYLRGLEYIAKYNLNNDVPYVHHRDCDMTYDEATVSSATRGNVQYFWEIPYAHYVSQMGLAAPYTAQMAALLRPDGGPTTWNSPDWFGFTSLSFYQDAVSSGAPTPTGLVASIAGRQITLSWWGTANALSYNVKRAISGGGPYVTIAVTGPNDTSYVDPGLSVGTTFYYVVSANTSGGEGVNSLELAAAPNDLLSGTVIGSPGSYANAGATIDNVFDGSFESFYDATNGSGDWAGLDLGAGVSAVITRIEYAPRPGFASRMVGGVFQGANDSNFNSPTTLNTIVITPADNFVTQQNGVLTSKTINNGNAFRYVRYLGPANANCNVGEIKFHGNISGLLPPAAPTNPSASLIGANQIGISWSAVATATSYNVKRAASSSGPYIIVANTPGTNVNDIVPPGGTNYFYSVSAINSVGESADSSAVVVSIPQKLTGATIGTPGSWSNLGNTVAKVFDGDLNTYFDGPDATGDWAGLDFGTGVSNIITQIQYCPRNSFASRMVGGIFQGANDPNFSSTVTLFTVTATPALGVMTVEAITNASAFRYVRYYGPANANCDVAEIEFDGFRSTVPLAPAALAAAAGDGQVSLTWPASSGAAGYSVKRSSASGGPYTTIARTIATNYVDGGLANGTMYYFVTSATNAVGESLDSTPAAARPVSLTIPQTAFNVSSGQIQLNWPQDHTGWTLQVQTNSLGTNWATIFGSNATNQLFLPIDTSLTGVFFRLNYR